MEGLTRADEASIVEACRPRLQNWNDFSSCPVHIRVPGLAGLPIKELMRELIISTSSRSCCVLNVTSALNSCLLEDEDSLHDGHAMCFATPDAATSTSVSAEPGEQSFQVYHDQSCKRPSLLPINVHKIHISLQLRVVENEGNP